MDIYAPWLPSHAYYAFHLLAWLGPIALLQWLAFPQLLWANRRAIFVPTLIIASYLVATDIVAVAFEVWHFDENLILAGALRKPAQAPLAFLVQPFGVPIEEWAFFFLTALIVAQSFVLFLPPRYRREPPKRDQHT